MIFARKTLVRGIAAASAAILIALAAQPSQARNGVKVGVLKCNVAGNASFVFGSSRRLSCVYTPTDKGRPEFYDGRINRYGIDIGYISQGTMLWAVFAPAKTVRSGALAGDYGGITANVAAGHGVGANALLGGSQKSIALQPLSIEGVKGLNIAAGIASINLRRAGR
jgi:hypothetical protein